MQWRLLCNRTVGPEADSAWTMRWSASSVPRCPRCAITRPSSAATPALHLHGGRGMSVGTQVHRQCQTATTIMSSAARKDRHAGTNRSPQSAVDARYLLLPGKRQRVRLYQPAGSLGRRRLCAPRSAAPPAARRRRRAAAGPARIHLNRLARARSGVCAPACACAPRGHKHGGRRASHRCSLAPGLYGLMSEPYCFSGQMSAVFWPELAPVHVFKDAPR